MNRYSVVHPHHSSLLQICSPPLMTAFLTGGLALLVYVFTLAPTVVALDSAELTTAAYSLGLVHAPGYPVYLLLGHLFTYLPLGDVGFRVNLLSAVAGAGTVTLVLLLVHHLTRAALPALMAGLSYAFCFYHWSLSVVAEMYTLQALFLAAMLWVLLQWRQTGAIRWPLIASGLAGLALANNPVTGLWWPGLLLLAWTAPCRASLTFKDCARMIGVFILALTPLLYHPLRSAAHPDFVQVGHFDATGNFHPVDLTQLWNLLWYWTGGQFAHLIFAYTFAEYVEQVLHFLYWLWAAYLGIGLPLGLLGIAILWQRNPVIALALPGTILPYTLFFIGYRVVDKDTMFLPVFLLWAVVMGVGLHWILAWAPARARAAGFCLPLALLLVNTAYIDVNQFWAPHNVARDRLQSADPEAVLGGGRGHALPSNCGRHAARRAGGQHLFCAPGSAAAPGGASDAEGADGVQLLRTVCALSSVHERELS